jgi:hypothetical protein
MDSFSNSFKKKVSDARDKLTEGSSLSTEKVNQILGEYRQAIASLEPFGLKVGKMRVLVSIPPEISTTIIGSIEQIDEDRVREMLEKNSEKKLLSAILSALLTTIHVRETIDLGNLKTVRIDISLGIPPRVAVDLI